MSTHTRAVIGHVGVDSGQIILVDPCYVENGLNYSEVCKTTCSDGKAGPWMNGAAVATSTGIGDGRYPVIVEYEDLPGWGRRVKSITVQFIEDEHDDDIDYEEFD